MSLAVIFAPLVSNPVQGTQDGTITNTDSGSHSVWSSMYWMPSVPHTLAISCGSAMMAVVPCCSTRLAKRDGCAMDDSMCTWLSISPGHRYAPPASYSSRPE